MGPAHREELGITRNPAQGPGAGGVMEEAQRWLVSEGEEEEEETDTCSASVPHQHLLSQVFPLFPMDTRWLLLASIAALAKLN